MFRYYCVIHREPVVSTLPSYTSMSNAVVGNTIYNLKLFHIGFMLLKYHCPVTLFSQTYNSRDLQFKNSKCERMPYYYPRMKGATLHTVVRYTGNQLPASSRMLLPCHIPKHDHTHNITSHTPGFKTAYFPPPQELQNIWALFQDFYKCSFRSKSPHGKNLF